MWAETKESNQQFVKWDPVEKEPKRYSNAERVRKQKEAQKEYKVIEFVLYRFDVSKETSMKDIMHQYQCENQELIASLYNGFTGLYKKEVCSYALFKNNENLEMAAEWLINNNGKMEEKKVNFDCSVSYKPRSYLSSAILISPGSL